MPLFSPAFLILWVPGSGSPCYYYRGPTTLLLRLAAGLRGWRRGERATPAETRAFLRLNIHRYFFSLAGDPGLPVVGRHPGLPLHTGGVGMGVRDARAARQRGAAYRCTTSFVPLVPAPLRRAPRRVPARGRAQVLAACRTISRERAPHASSPGSA